MRFMTWLNNCFAKSEMILVMRGNTCGRQEEQTITDDRLLAKSLKKGEINQ